MGGDGRSYSLTTACPLGNDFRAGVLIVGNAWSCVTNFLLTYPLFQRDHERIQGLSNRLIQSINAQVEHVVRNGDVNGYPGCVNLSFSYVEGESLLMALKVRAAGPLTCRNGIDVFSSKDIALSSGSACTSASLEPSYVLRALGTKILPSILCRLSFHRRCRGYGSFLSQIWSWPIYHRG